MIKFIDGIPVEDVRPSRVEKTIRWLEKTHKQYIDEDNLRAYPSLRGAGERIQETITKYRQFLKDRSKRK